MQAALSADASRVGSKSGFCVVKDRGYTGESFSLRSLSMFSTATIEDFGYMGQLNIYLVVIYPL